MKKWICLIMTLLLMLTLSCCGKTPTEDAGEPVVEPEPVLNPLTGLPLQDASHVNSRPVAVMLNNLHLAMPQHGVSDADMIFEFNVEGGITRMVGFFQEIDRVGTIGSIRSARACFIETVLGMDAIYAHAGGSEEAFYMIYRYGLDDIDENDIAYWRDEDRAQTMDFEHTLMTSGEKLSEYIADRGFRTQHEADYRYPVTFVEDGTPVNGTQAEHIQIPFSYYKTGTFDYDAQSKLYMVGQYGDAYIDGNTGRQVGVTNLLVLYTDVYNSGDAKGHMVIDLQGAGAGTFFCGGKAVDIEWRKADMSDPFTYYLTDGTPLSLGAGRTYVCVVSDTTVLSVA